MLKKLFNFMFNRKEDSYNECFGISSLYATVTGNYSGPFGKYAKESVSMILDELGVSI